MTSGGARVGAAMLFALVVTTWPMAVMPTGTMLGAPGLEAVDHVWALWLALHDGPIVIATVRVDAPEGYGWVLADPINLPPFALGHAIGGPAVGLSLVHALNLIVAGLAAVALGRVFLPPERRAPAFSAVVAVTLPPLAAGLFTGMTEAQTFGWSALAVAATGWALAPRVPPDRGPPRHAEGPEHDDGAAAPPTEADPFPTRRVVLAGLAAGLTAWAGAYALLYALLAALPVALWALVRARRAAGVARVVLSCLAIAVVAAAVASPVVWAQLTQRSDALPGAQSLTPSVFADPERLDNRALGADLARLFLPFRSGLADDWHTVYLGGVAVCLAVVGGARRGFSSPLMPTALWMLVLSLGVYLQAGGQVLRWVDGRILVLPAGLLSLGSEAIGRAPRWYRAAAMGGILLAPLAAAGANRLAARLRPAWRTPALAVLGALVVVDAVRVAPLPWPRAVFHAAPPAGYADMEDGTPLVEVPLVRFSSRVGARAGGATLDPIRHPALLWQTFHGRSIGGNPHQAGLVPRSGAVVRAVQGLNVAALAGDVVAARASARALGDLGFGWLVHHPAAILTPLTAGLASVLGVPDVDTPEVQAWRLRAATTPARP